MAPSHVDTQKLFHVLWGMNRNDHESDEPKTRDDRLFAQGSVARLEAFTRPFESEVAIAAPNTVKVGEVFSVSVTIENSNDHALKNIKIALTPMVIGETAQSGVLGGDGLLIDDKDVVIESLGAHKKKTVKIDVKSNQAGLLGLRAGPAELTAVPRSRGRGGVRGELPDGQQLPAGLRIHARRAQQPLRAVRPAGPAPRSCDRSHDAEEERSPAQPPARPDVGPPRRSRPPILAFASGRGAAPALPCSRRRSASHVGRRRTVP